MRDPENIRELVGLKPDLIGFIFFEGSKRFVGEGFVLPEIDPEIRKVGVFVNASLEYILSRIEKYKLDLVQLHGDESADFCHEIKKRIPVIKAFGVNEDFNFDVLTEYAGRCNYFLFDTKSDLHGGSGKVFDWSLLKDYRGTTPFFLSGGIGPDEVDALVRSGSEIYGLDVNSRLEISPGLKNIQECKKIIKQLR